MKSSRIDGSKLSVKVDQFSVSGYQSKWGRYVSGKSFRVRYFKLETLKKILVLVMTCLRLRHDENNQSEKENRIVQRKEVKDLSCQNVCMIISSEILITQNYDSNFESKTGYKTFKELTRAYQVPIYKQGKQWVEYSDDNEIQTWFSR